MDVTAREQPLAEFLRAHQDELIRGWMAATRACTPAAALAGAAFADHMPFLVSRLADTVEAISANRWGDLPLDAAKRHALSRLTSGFPLGAVATELFLLRDVGTQLIARLRAQEGRTDDLRLLSWAVDAGIRESAELYAQVQQRTLAALDRLSKAALESKSLGELLSELAMLVLDTTPAVDTVGIALVEGDRLVLRAAAGLEQHLVDRFSTKVGQGFGGQIVAERTPRIVRDAAHEAEGASPVIYERGVKALCGLPLLVNDAAIGVLQMGSVSTDAFAQRDLTLLRTIADRASSAVALHRSREQAERIVRARDEALAMLDSVFDTAPVGLAMFDRDLRYTRVNRSVVAMNGVPAAAHVGRLASEVLPGIKDIPQVEEQNRQLLTTGAPIVDVELTGETPGAPGLVRQWLCSFYPIRVQAGIVGVGAVIREVTEERRAMEFQRHLISIVGHDIRSPLSAISLSANTLLRSSDLSDRQARSLDRINASAARIEGIIRALLDYTRVRVGQGIPLERRGLDLVAVCGAVLEEARAANPDREFRCEGPPRELGEWDADRLAQMLSNLVRNAVSYGTRGTPIVVRHAGDAETVRVEVDNEGPSIPPEALPVLFEPFSRATTADTAAGAQRGLGLGLFISREIVRAHGGQITVRSAGGRTVFAVTLPRRLP